MRVRKKITLSKTEQQELHQMIKVGKHKASEINHARILLDLNSEQKTQYTKQQVAERNHVCVGTVTKISELYLTGGIEQAIYRKHRETPPVAPKYTGEVEARIIKLACSEPPEGRSRWTLQLLADEAVKLQIVDSASDNGIRLLLKKQNLSLT